VAQHVEVDRTGADVGVAVGAGAGRVARVVDVQQVDSAGDRE
jgi:hypothetical protein